MTAPRHAALAVALVFALLVALASGRAGLRGGALMGDFRAFYCAARVTLAHGDPYRPAPMMACESEASPVPFYRAVPPMVVPAPLPGYVVALFVPFALLPLPLAAIAWILVLLASSVAIVVLLVRLGWASASCSTVVLALPVLAVCVPPGELPPIAAAGIALAAYASALGRPWLVALGVALAMTEPQLGLPLALAAVVCDRRLWLPVGMVAVALACASIATVGWAANVEYVTRFLPEHIAAEIPRVQQYSLSWIVHQLGGSDALALLAGRVSYAFALGAGAIAARYFAKRGEAPAALAVAPALALIGGPFVHVDHLVAAVPAALWCARHVRPAALGIGAAIALALPVATVFGYPLLMLAVPFAAAWVVSEYESAPGFALRGAAIATIVALLIAIVSARVGLGLDHAGTAFHGARSAQSSWGRYIQAHDIATSWALWLVKFPVWAALAAIGYAAILRLRDPRSAVSRYPTPS